MIGQAVTIVRVRETIGAMGQREQMTFTFRGSVKDVVTDAGGQVTGVYVDGVREGTGVRRLRWFAMGPRALDGSLLASQSATLDACGHGVTDGCSCAVTGLVWSAGDVVLETVSGTREFEISAEEADTVVAMFEGRDGFVVRRWWDAVSYTVAVGKAGRVRPFLSYMMPLV